MLSALALAATLVLQTPTAPDPSVEESLNFLSTQVIEDNADPHNGEGYKGNRTNLFGTPWKDVDNNGCDTRNDILARDLKDVDYSKKDGVQDLSQARGQGVSSCPNATVYRGVLDDPYTGKVIKFSRGEKSATIQIDHVIPLGYVYKHGGWKIAKDGRKDILEQIANDPNNLLAVDGATNGAKSDQGPATWMPPNTAYQCTYALKWVKVLQTYQDKGLTISGADKDKLVSILSSCADMSQSAPAPSDPPSFAELTISIVSLLLAAIIGVSLGFVGKK